MAHQRLGERDKRRVLGRGARRLGWRRRWVALGMSFYTVYLLEIVKLASPLARIRVATARERRTA